MACMFAWTWTGYSDSFSHCESKKNTQRKKSFSQCTKKKIIQHYNNK